MRPTGQCTGAAEERIATEAMGEQGLEMGGLGRGGEPTEERPHGSLGGLTPLAFFEREKEEKKKAA
jgi:hypothetical protein